MALVGEGLALPNKKITSKGIVLLCAGGTGGHLFPAEAVAHELIQRGYEVHLAADDRVRKFAGSFPASEVHQITSATLGSKSPIAIAKALWKLGSGYMQSRGMINKIAPVAVVGFGGYPTLPPLLAASHKGVPTLVHEANAVLGRANRFLASRVDKVAVGFGKTRQLGNVTVEVTGNPVRPDILAASRIAYPKRTKTKPFNLLVFGGSQGAAFFGSAVPQAIALLDAKIRARLNVVQQVREDDRADVAKAYEQMNVDAEVATFFSDMADRMANAHLVVSRAGASTVSELAVVGRPAILVPYPHALDHDQANNASAIEASGGAWIHLQQNLTPEKLATELTSLIENPKTLEAAAQSAKQTGQPNAASGLVDLLETIV